MGNGRSQVSDSTSFFSALCAKTRCVGVVAARSRLRLVRLA